MEFKCPKCGSDKIDQYRMLTGAIWCNDCGFRAEHKEWHNPFIAPPTSDNSDCAKCNDFIVRMGIKQCRECGKPL